MINPIIELRDRLDEAGIPYENVDGCGMSRVHYPHRYPFVCSAIWGEGSYGYENGLIEIMGLLTPEEEEYDSVVGNLTVDEVFNRIKNDWEESKEVE